MSDTDSKPKSRYDQLPKMRTPAGRWVYDPAHAPAPEVDAAVIRDLFTEMHHIDAADAREAVPEAVEAEAVEGGAILTAGSDAARAHTTATIEPSIVPALPSAPVRITEMVAARTQSTVRANGGAGEATSGSGIDSGHANERARASAKVGGASAKVGGASTKATASDENATASGEKASRARRRLVVTLGALGVACALVIGALVWGPSTSGQGAAGTAATASTTGAAGAGGATARTAGAGAGTAAAPPSSAPGTRAEHDSSTAPGASPEPHATASPGSGGAPDGNGGAGSRLGGTGPGVSPGPTATDDPYMDAAAPRATATPRVTATAVVTAPPSAVPAAPPPSASTPAAGPATQPSAIPSVKPVEGDRVFGR